ncbi:inovirus Gp2 family protein [Citrobacter sp. S39]|uniref:YagK/YfjJ domain-containing protein n=1 Tax=Enterobacteriaceae TaxID=543 RepID=UPI0012A95BA5|nr:MULTISPECIES: inovirus-type Gp2 protein [Enterobacteriaceae]MDX7510891.1 inovirus-type Gp2 protein [Citrobacter freundii]QFX87341.1 inovirus Gp2 family protein [Citrobacter sp. S39]
MNYYGEPETSREADNANVSLIRATLQQATDHYPRLAALGFTLQHANPHSQQNRAQLLRFHAETYCRIGKYIQARLSTGKPSQPTLLRWLWEERNTSACRMILLFNLAVCYYPRYDASPAEGMQAMTALLTAAWSEVEPDGMLIEMAEYRAERTEPATFGKHYASLQEAALRMTFPVCFARSCPIA